jgi:hypothetical protein
MKIICSGGLGDAVMILGKLRSPQLINEDVHLTHVHKNGILYNELNEFYSYHKIKAEVKIVDFSWIDEHKKEYDLELTSDYKGINPFPKLNYQKIENIDIVMCLVAGQRKNRNLNTRGLEDFVKDKNIKRIGNGETLTEAINIICSANIIISPEGFVTYMGGLAGKRVFIYNHNKKAIDERAHPAWKVELFDSLSEINELLRHSKK